MNPDNFYANLVAVLTAIAIPLFGWALTLSVLGLGSGS